MASVNVSSFLNSSFDWQTMVDKLMEVEATPKVNLQKEQGKNTDRITALNEIKTAMLDFQTAVQAMWNSDLYSARNVTSDTANTTWKANSSAGAPLGTYRIAVSQLATTARLTGAGDIGAGLTGSTLATLNTATAVTAGVFTINGQPVTVSTTDSLDQVLAAIGTATGGTVTATYDAGADKIRLASSAPLMVGAANDTSNFLGAMGLGNAVTFDAGTYSVASTGTLGTTKLNSPLADAGLRTAVTGAGSFAINGVTIAYDAATDSLATVLNRINASTAGVTATYDASADRVTLANNKTGDFGISISEISGGLPGALGLTGATFTAGLNATFSVNGGPARTSASNTLDATALGITGLSVTVNSESTQTLEVATEAATLHTAIQGFIDKYNALQTLIDTHTQISTTGGVVTAAVLADNREVEAWSTQIRALAFGASDATGTVKRLDDLGLDFTGIDGQLTIKDSTKLTTALLDHPTDVASFFQSATGLAARLHGYLTTAVTADSSTQSRLGLSNTQIDKQIADIERRLASQRELLTSAFLKMQDAQSKAQSQNTYLTNTFFKDNSSN